MEEATWGTGNKRLSTHMEVAGTESTLLCHRSHQSTLSREELCL